MEILRSHFAYMEMVKANLKSSSDTGELTQTKTNRKVNKKIQHTKHRHLRVMIIPPSRVPNYRVIPTTVSSKKAQLTRQGACRTKNLLRRIMIHIRRSKNHARMIWLYFDTFYSGMQHCSRQSRSSSVSIHFQKSRVHPVSAQIAQKENTEGGLLDVWPRMPKSEVFMRTEKKPLGSDRWMATSTSSPWSISTSVLRLSNHYSPKGLPPRHGFASSSASKSSLSTLFAGFIPKEEENFPVLGSP